MFFSCTMAQNRTYPAETNKGVLNQYLTLPQEKDSVMCEYVWIDGTGDGVRSKCRTLSYIPKEASGKCISIMWTHNILCLFH